MEKDHGRHAAANDLALEMNQQDREYRQEHGLDMVAEGNPADLEEELREASGPAWEQTAKRIRLKEIDGSGEKIFAYPATHFTPFLGPYATSAISSTVRKAD